MVVPVKEVTVPTFPFNVEPENESPVPNDNSATPNPPVAPAPNNLFCALKFAILLKLTAPAAIVGALAVPDKSPAS